MFGNKRKYKRGHVSESQWVFGMVEQGTGWILVLVIVKKSSPKNLSADSRSTVGRLSADSRPTVARLLADSRPFVGRQLADSRPTGFTRNIGYLSADSGPTVGRQSADCW